MLALIMPTLGSASSYFSVHVLNTPEDKKLVVNLSKMYGKQVTCSILDEGKNVVYREKVATGSQIAKRYDLNALPLGSYTLVIDDALSVEKLGFTLTDETIIYHSAKSQVVYKPIIKVGDNKKVSFNLLALGKDVEIAVMDDNKTLYQKTYSDMPSINKQISFEDVLTGEYTVVVKVAGETFYKTVNI